jgi:diaminopimelate decarboxylase
MPISTDFRQRLYPHLTAIAAHFGTPFHIYDEVGIRQTARHLYATFRDFDFREFYAVKALPNPHILRLLYEEGCGFDCSSVPELMLARQVGAAGETIMFTSNNTTPQEFAVAAADGGCILNLDDIHQIDKVPDFPDRISFRFNPGSDTGNTIIGKPEEAKFGVPKARIVEAYRLACARGARRFGLHAMVVSNERRVDVLLGTVSELCRVAQQLQAELGIRLEFINIGGGLGIPYRPDDTPLDLSALADGISRLWRDAGLTGVKLFMESGRYVTGPHGVLVTRVINQKASYRHYVGVDASMSALMRPGLYGAYHHIDVPGKTADDGVQVVDVVGSLCENNDKFAVQRALPPVEDGDLLVIHDTGAHGHAMGFNYNGRLRPQELLWRADGTIEKIRRAETQEDYFATLNFDRSTLILEKTTRKA